jgi:hypothetical protein
VIQNYGDPKFRSVDVTNYRDIPGNVRGYFGFRTSGAAIGGTSRNLLYKNVMMKTIEINSSRIKDKTLISEFCNLTLRNGRIDHEANKHDDQVISYLLACFLIFYGKNLDKYGILDSQVLSSIADQGNKVSPIYKAEQLRLRTRIAELEDRLASSPSYSLRQSYERELAGLRQLVDDSITNVKPIAVSQVKYEEKLMNPRKNSEARLMAFTRRFLAR